MGASVQSVTNRYLLRKAAHYVAANLHFRYRVAGLEDLSPSILEAFGEAFLLSYQGKVAFGSLVKKLTQLVDFFKQAPKVWEQIKRFLGVHSWSDIPGALKRWAQKGLGALKSALHHMAQVFPLSLYFVPTQKMPGLTDLMHRILVAHPDIRKALESIRGGVKRLDEWMDKYLPALQRPLLAAIYIWVWLNVAELSWDFQALAAGFTGAISLSDLFASLPESGVGLIAAMFGLGYAALPITLMARILWLVGNQYLEWVPGKGLRVQWDKITGQPHPPELVPVF